MASLGILSAVLAIFVITLCCILLSVVTDMDRMRIDSADSIERHQKELEDLRERAAVFAKANVESLVNVGIIVDDGEWLVKRMRQIPLRVTDEP